MAVDMYSMTKVVIVMAGGISKLLLQDGAESLLTLITVSGVTEIHLEVPIWLSGQKQKSAREKRIPLI